MIKNRAAFDRASEQERWDALAGMTPAESIAIGEALLTSGMRTARMAASRGLAPRADVADDERRDGPPELVLGCKDAVLAMPVLPRRRHEIRQTVTAKTTPPRPAVLEGVR